MPDSTERVQSIGSKVGDFDLVDRQRPNQLFARFDPRGGSTSFVAWRRIIEIKYAVEHLALALPAQQGRGKAGTQQFPIRVPKRDDRGGGVDGVAGPDLGAVLTQSADEVDKML